MDTSILNGNSISQNIDNSEPEIKLPYFDVPIRHSSIFVYFVIFCVCIVYFRNINITLGTLLGIILSILIMCVLYYSETTTLNNTTQLHNLKSTAIKPTPKNIIKYNDLTDYIFSIQDFYEYNPQAYESLINAIDTFIEIYETILLDNALAGDYYAIAESRKLYALNSLHSIIIMIPPNKIVIKKINTAMEILEALLNKYLMLIYNANENYIKTHGYFNNTKVIELNIKPYNTYKQNDLIQYY